ncbi:hypothetical protein M758_9G186200 [Ceratodon purpureus]|nr:hypothetical protein M758_9G186200 [Ceratodon purpureus]
MEDDARADEADGGDWDGTIRTALLRRGDQEGGYNGDGDGDGGYGDGDGVDPSEVENLKSALGRVSATWRKRTQGQRLSAQRWIEREAHEEPRAQWRNELGELLEATHTHVIIVVLLLVDLAATAADILKTIHNKSHDLDVCVEMVEQCTTCIGHFERSPEWKWTYWISIVILAVLMLNVFALIVANGRSFFGNPLYLLDLVVVSTALGLEILLDADTAGLIIILTLWRIVRVAHGIFEVTDEAWEKNIHQLEAQVKRVQEAYDRDQELLREKDRRIAEQAERISELGARLGESNDYGSSAYE